MPSATLTKLLKQCVLALNIKHSVPLVCISSLALSQQQYVFLALMMPGTERYHLIYTLKLYAPLLDMLNLYVTYSLNELICY